MAYLIFRNAEKSRIEFYPTSVLFIRGIETTKTVSVRYTNASGQVVLANQEIFKSGIQGTEDYIRVSFKNNTTLLNSSTVELEITNYPNDTQVDVLKNFTYDSSQIDIQFYFNSKPKTVDVIKDIPNRDVYTFLDTDFPYIDYDGDVSIGISVFGDVDGFEKNGMPYVEGNIITISELMNEEFKYNPLDQDAYYEKINTWKVVDNNGNMSDNEDNLLQINVAQEEYIPCENPVITSILPTTQTVVEDGIPTNLEIVATNATNYQWYSNTANNMVGGTVLIGETSNVFTPPTDAIGTLYYYAEVFNGACSIFTDVVNVVVEAVTIPCIAPILTVATNSSMSNFHLEWNYNSADYSAEVPTASVLIYYSIDGGATFTEYTLSTNYPSTSSDITISGLTWEVIVFKVKILTRTCELYSNELTIDIT